MGKFAYAVIASAFVSTATAPLPASAYTQADADACTTDAFEFALARFRMRAVLPSALPKTNDNSAQPAPVCLVVHVAQALTANLR